jgi:hypothetical protein
MMRTTCMRAEPTPYEALLIATTLESGTGQEALLETIDRFNLERHLLQLQCAKHLWNEHQVVQHLRALKRELDALWGEVRRIRAVRRIHLEKALGIDPTWVPYEPEQLLEKWR